MYDPGFIDIEEGVDNGLSANSKIKEAFIKTKDALNDLDAKGKVTSNLLTANLNTLVTTGIFDINGGTNTPNSLTAGRLMVIENNQDSNKVEQVFIGSDGVKYERTTSDGGDNFSTWVISLTSVPIHKNILSTSSTVTQEPAGRGVDNKIQISFGTSEIVTPEVTYNTDGSITFNKAGQYRVRMLAQYGRAGSSGASILVFRFTLNGSQFGKLLASKVDNADILNPWSDMIMIDVEANDVLAAELIRDSAGNNSGGLFSITTDFGVVPSTSLTIHKIK